MNNMILVTGATGFLGGELLKRLDTSKVRAVARNEGKLIELKEHFPNIEIMTGDIADKFFCDKICKDADELYHLAAFKHVGLAEKQPLQCIHSNLTGTINLLHSFWGGLFVAISTDKAAQVNGVYGATKYLMEKVIEEFSNVRQLLDYRVVRYGNVLYSTGSVLCKWKKIMQGGGEVVITDPYATRFFWTREQAVDHIFECIDEATDATPYVPEMKAITMGDLLIAMQRKYGKCSVREIGLQVGENLHETMDGKIFSNEVEQYSIDEITELV